MKNFLNNFFTTPKNKLPSILTVLKSILFLIGFFCFLFLFAKILTPQEKSYLNFAKDNEWLIVLVFFVIQELIFFLSIFIFNPKNKAFWLRILSFKKIAWWKTTILVAQGYGMFILFSLFLGLLHHYGISLPGFTEQEDLIWLFGNGIFSKAVAFGTIVILGPFVEEVFFRWYILQTFLNRINKPWVATVLTSVIFSLGHLDLSAAGSVFILGLIINHLYIKSGSLIPGLAFHILNNGIAFILLSVLAIQ